MNHYRPNRWFKKIHKTEEKAHKAKESKLGQKLHPQNELPEIQLIIPFTKKNNKNHNKHKHKNWNKQTRLISYTRSYYVLQKQGICLLHPQKYTITRENKMGVKHKPDLLNTQEKQKLLGKIRLQIQKILTFLGGRQQHKTQK